MATGTDCIWKHDEGYEGRLGLPYETVRAWMEKSDLKNHIRTGFGGTQGVYVESLVGNILAATGEPVIHNPDDWKAEFNLTPDFVVGDPHDGGAVVEVFDRTAGLDFGKKHLVPQTDTMVLNLDADVAASDLLGELRKKSEKYAALGLPLVFAVAVSGEARQHDLFLKRALYGEHWVHDLAGNVWSEPIEYGFLSSIVGPMLGSEKVIGILIVRDAFFVHTPTIQFYAQTVQNCPSFARAWTEPTNIREIVRKTWLGIPCAMEVEHDHQNVF